MHGWLTLPVAHFCEHEPQRSATLDLVTVERVGRYELRDRLGAGGAGVVFRAWDPASQRDVALKLLHPREGGAVAQQRFVTECHALARLDHPHIVRVLDVGQDRGRPFLVLELVEGRSLQDRLDCEGPLPIDDVALVASALALALQHAHRQGIVHRDLKPANVLEGEGTIRLTDFGLARDLESGSLRLTATGQFTGSPGFWSPEQARGAIHQVGPRSDIYGLGATLYALLTGAPPHSGESLIEALQAAGRQIEPPSRRRAGIPPRLEQLVMRCLALNPDDRYASSHELSADLTGCLEDDDRPRVSRALVVGAILTPLLVLGGGLLLVREARQAAHEEIKQEYAGFDQNPTATPSPAPSPRTTATPLAVPTPTPTVDAALATARAARSTREWDRALKALGARSDPRALFLRGQIHFEHGEVEQPKREMALAAKAFERIPHGHRLGPPAAAYLALCLRALDRPWLETARRALAAKADERAFPVLLHVRQHVLNASHGGGPRRELDATLIAQYRLGTQRVPSDLVSWSGIARAHARRGEFAQALAVLRQALEIVPDAPLLHHTAGYLSLDWGVKTDDESHLRAAIVFLDQAIALEPRLADAFVSRGQTKTILASRRQPPSKILLEQAVVDFYRANQRNPQNPRTLGLALSALELLGRDTDALQVLDQLVLGNPTHVGYRLKRALLRNKTKNFAGALADLQEARPRLTPNDARLPELDRMANHLRAALETRSD